MAGLLDPILKDAVVGSAEVRKIFQLSKGAPVAGCMITSGRIVKGKLRVRRRKEIIYEGLAQSLRSSQKRFAPSQFGGLLQHLLFEFVTGRAKLSFGPLPERGAQAYSQSCDRERQKARQIQKARRQGIVHSDQVRQEQRGEHRRKQPRPRAAEPSGGNDADLKQPRWVYERR